MDAAVLRPGRLDRCLYMGVSDTDESQLNIVRALTRKFILEDSVDLSAVVERCSMSFSGTSSPQLFIRLDIYSVGDLSLIYYLM